MQVYEIRSTMISPFVIESRKASMNCLEAQHEVTQEFKR